LAITAKRFNIAAPGRAAHPGCCAFFRHRTPAGCNRQDSHCATPLGLGFLATYDPGCAARPGALVLDPFGDNHQIEKNRLGTHMTFIVDRPVGHAPYDVILDCHPLPNLGRCEGFGVGVAWHSPVASRRQAN
jgi:hypothetical protein